MNAQPIESRYHYHVMRRAIDLIDARRSGSDAERTGARDADEPGAFSAAVFILGRGLAQALSAVSDTWPRQGAACRTAFTTLEAPTRPGFPAPDGCMIFFCRWEAMSPGEYARRQGLTSITAGFEGPFGEALAMGTDRGLCGMGFSEESGRDATLADLMSRWPNANSSKRPKSRPWVEAAFGESGETRLALIGAPFQIKVWEALLQVPSGHVTTYSEIAAAIGNPKAVRAVGTAVGRNPIAWLIPCHRALRKSGGLGGYHWGLPVKRAMLAYEAARADARSA